jgi:hypothetical protein
MSIHFLIGFQNCERTGSGSLSSRLSHDLLDSYKENGIHAAKFSGPCSTYVCQARSAPHLPGPPGLPGG